MVIEALFMRAKRMKPLKCPSKKAYQYPDRTNYI